MTKQRKNSKIKELLTDVGFLVASGIMFAFAYNMFLVPGKIIIGGVGGLSTMLNILYGLPTGLMSVIINTPLMALFMYFYGVRSSVKGIIGIIVSAIFVDTTAFLGIIPPAFPNPEENSLLYALFGGVVLGIAIGIMFARGYTTGGSDLAALVVKVKWQGISTSRLILLFDAIVVISAAVATKNYTSVFFSFLAIFMSSTALGVVTGGFDKTKLAYIFSDKYEEIAQAITEKMRHGVTLLSGMGWYTKANKNIILCVVKKNEVFTLKKMVHTIDEEAFMILGEAEETIGRGFKDTIGDVVMVPKSQKQEKNETSK